MGKTRRYSPYAEDYPQVSHRVPRSEVARISLATQLLSLSYIPEPLDCIDIPDEDELGGIPRERMLDLLQVIGEELLVSVIESE